MEKWTRRARAWAEPNLSSLYTTEPTDLAGWFWFRFEAEDDGRKSHRTQIRSNPGTSSNACVQTKPDHVLLHKTGGQLIPSLLQLTFPQKINITRLPPACLLIYLYIYECVAVCVLLSSCTVGRIYILPYGLSWILIPAALWRWETSHRSCILSLEKYRFRFSRWMYGTDWVRLDRLPLLHLHLLQHDCWMANSLVQTAAVRRHLPADSRQREVKKKGNESVRFSFIKRFRQP